MKRGKIRSEEIFEEITTENFPKLMKDNKSQIQYVRDKVIGKKWIYLEIHIP